MSNKESAMNNSSASHWRIPLICLGLIALVFAIYWQTIRYEFINFDDPNYITCNAHVLRGLTWDNLCWSIIAGLKSGEVDTDNWMPLTLLSHMAVVHGFGLQAGAHHALNIILHAAGTVLLFLVLRSMTGATWRSFIVAALFAIHPLHVESVAWVAERKDVLSGLFFMLTLWAYLAYTRKRSIGRYSFVILCFVLGLMSKPMLVTLPFVLLLLDYWPLQRMGRSMPGSMSISILIAEKIPLLALSVIDCLVTISVQRVCIEFSKHYPFSERIINAAVAYVRYLGKTLWPCNLSIFYPMPINGVWPMIEVVFSILLLVVITLVVWSRRRIKPYLLIGWFWYLGMLVPVVGIVQVGSQAFADRYTYLPLIGIFIGVTWLFGDLLVINRADFIGLVSRKFIFRIVLFISAGIFIVLSTLSYCQTRYWQNDLTIWKHTLHCTKENAVAYNNMGSALLRQNLIMEALAQYREALRISPDYAEAHSNLAFALSKVGFKDESLVHYREAIKFNPDHPIAHNNLGSALLEMGQTEQAIDQYRAALKIRPEYADAHNNLGNILLQQGKIRESIEQFQCVLRIKPNYAEAHNGLGAAFFREGLTREAEEQYRAALKIRPSYADAHYNLGNLLFKDGLLREADEQYREVLRDNPDCAEAHNALGVGLFKEGHTEESLEEFRTALRLRPQYKEADHNLTSALLQKGAAVGAESYNLKPDKESLKAKKEPQNDKLNSVLNDALPPDKDPSKDVAKQKGFSYFDTNEVVSLTIASICFLLGACIIYIICAPKDTKISLEINPLKPDLTSDPKIMSVNPRKNRLLFHRWFLNLRTLLVSLGLLALVFVVFTQTLRHEFVNFDDPFFVTENPIVQQGITIEGLKYAVTAVCDENWHPLTMIAHMVDCQLYGNWAGGHHLTCLQLHALGAVLLFLLLRKMTGSLWKSALVAAIWAVHPLRVESVAWIAELKDVLSGVFFFLTMMAYVDYARRRTLWRYLLVMALLACGLMSKPMLVTLPFVLLLLDYWPLGRMKDITATEILKKRNQVKKKDTKRFPCKTLPLKLLLIEKLPLLLLAVISCGITMMTQKEVLERCAFLTFGGRCENALVATVIYCCKMVWPTSLAVYYPLTLDGWPLWEVIGSAVLLFAVTVVVLFQRRFRPYLAVGWFWYLGMLVPVIGIIKVGGQAYADRYTYLPQIGLIIALVWLLADWVGEHRGRRIIMVALSVLVLGLLMIVAHHQGTFWKNGLTLWGHTLSISGDSDLVDNNLGVVEMMNGKTEEAELHFRKSLKINPAQVDGHCNLGLALIKRGKKEEAINEYREAVKYAPQSTKILIRFTDALAALDCKDETIKNYLEIVRREPESVELRSNLGIELFRAGREQEGIHELDKAYGMEPKSVLIQNNLSYALATAHEDALLDGERALQLATQVNQSTGGEVPALLETLAAAQAATGDFTKALKTVRRALDLAEASGDKEICTTLRKEISLYEQGIPLRDPR